MKSNKKFRFVKKSRTLLIIMIASTALFAACGNKTEDKTANEDAAKDSITLAPTATPVPTVTIAAEVDDSAIVYENEKYAFKFTMPDSWKDYTIVTEEWEGISLTDEKSQEITESGPIINIRHPLWTEEAPRQDIPIMIFTLAQWDLVEKEEIGLGAAPIGPSELGRNAEYVFALPARYNYAFITGFEEVDEMIQNSAFEIIDGKSHLDN
ncbi:MAG: hypothetical protein WBI07_00075 [Mobilitalea sp.]